MPATIPPSSIVVVLAAPSTKFPVMVRLPGELPGARLAAPTVKLPVMVPEPPSVPPFICIPAPPTVTLPGAAALVPNLRIPAVCVNPPLKPVLPLVWLKVPWFVKSWEKLKPPVELIVPELVIALEIVRLLRFRVPLFVIGPVAVQFAVLLAGISMVPPVILIAPLPASVPP